MYECLYDLYDLLQIKSCKLGILNGVRDIKNCLVNFFQFRALQVFANYF